MAGLDDMNNFVSKFVSLWKAGKNASLKVESKSGRGSVMLELDLGFPHPPPSHLPPQQHHHQQVKVGAARVRRHERREAGRREDERQEAERQAAERQAAERQAAERQAAEYAATCAGNASNDEEESTKTAKMAAKKEKEVIKNEEAPKKEVKTAKKEEEAAKVSESDGIDDEQRDAKIEAKDAKAPYLLGVVGDRFKMKTEKVTVNEGESVETARSSDLSVEIVSDGYDVIDTSLKIVEDTVNDIMNFGGEENKDSDSLEIRCENDLIDNLQGRDYIVPPPAPPIPLGLWNPVENEWEWDSDDDYGRNPLTASRLRRQKRSLLKIVRNPDGTTTGGIRPRMAIYTKGRLKNLF